MTEEPRSAEGLKPCPNVECSGGKLRMSQRGIPLEDFMFIWCEGCGIQGPCSQCYSEAQRLWNALPRPTTDTVERAAVERALDEPGCYCNEVSGYVCGYCRVRQAIRALPSAGGGEDKLREALNNCREIISRHRNVPYSEAEEYASIAANALVCIEREIGRAALQQEQDHD